LARRQKEGGLPIQESQEFRVRDDQVEHKKGSEVTIKNEEKAGVIEVEMMDDQFASP